MPWICRTKQRRCSMGYYTECPGGRKAKGGRADHGSEGQKGCVVRIKVSGSAKKKPLPASARVFPYVSLSSCLKYSPAASHRGAKVSPGDGRPWNPDTLSKKHTRWRLPNAFNVFDQTQTSTSTGEKLEGFSHRPPGLSRAARRGKSTLIKKAVHTGSYSSSIPALPAARAGPVSTRRPA